MSGREVVKALSSFGFRIVSVRGSHAKLRRVLVSGEQQTLTVPLHKRIRPGTLHALFRQACRFLPEADLRPWFFTK
ncbi:MAG: type II toxin-antitoxin system HicA family toxin [Acetobacteraceae bacterium]|nr:type II toxin-antitoxin system HicA family toxin [Acetobacteraceae bacterium]